MQFRWFSLENSPNVGANLKATVCYGTAIAQRVQPDYQPKSNVLIGCEFSAGFFCSFSLQIIGNKV